MLLHQHGELKMLYEITDKIVNRRLLKTEASAARRNKDFNLDAAYLRNILEQEVCAYSGEPFKEFGPDMMTLERWDNDKGYVKGNVIPVKKKYNCLRGSLTIEQLVVAGKVKANLVKNLDRPETLSGKAKAHHDTIQRIKKNLEGRVRALEMLLAKDPSKLNSVDKVQLNTLPTRIESATKELERMTEALAKDMKGVKKDLKHRVKTANDASVGYGIIAKALLRFEHMNAHNYVRLKRGLPMIQKGE